MTAVALTTAVAAQIRLPVPGTDVPMTLQLLAVLIAGLVLPAREAVGGLLLYLLCGGIGLPVFAPGSTGLWGVTGGYILGFVFGGGAAALLRGREGRPWQMLLAASSGAATVLAAGVAWRAMWTGDWTWAAATGALPFAPKALIEVLLAVAIAGRIARRPASRDENNE
jgi:biotin transport system substrate-specific component